LPLTSQTWSRDIQLREDVSIADEISSSPTPPLPLRVHLTPTVKTGSVRWPLLLQASTSISIKGLPSRIVGHGAGWTIIELNAAAQVGRPIDTQKYDGMQLKWNMDTDEQVYIGDTAKGAKGLLNLIQVTPTNATKTWATSTTDEIRASINQVLSNAWARSAYSKVPEDLLIPPEQYSFLASTIVSSAGNQSC
jgi:hypothetical protein